MRDFIRRLHPPTNNPYANLAVAVLFYAIKDLRMDEDALIEWSFSDECAFWCRSAGITHSEFCKRLLSEIEKDEENQLSD